jgi:hypothetical protein
LPIAFTPKPIYNAPLFSLFNNSLPYFYKEEGY